MILVAGIGNIFLGDDAFGVEVVRCLRARPLPAEVRLIDFGIRGLDLAYALPEYDAAILVDTVARGRPAGTLYVLEPRVGGEPGVDMHGMSPHRVLAWIDPAAAPATLRLVGCEPRTFGEEGVGHDGLSPPVRAAVAPAAALVEQLVAEMLDA